MQKWAEQLTSIINRDKKAVLVTVVGVWGSVPREIGATLIVSSGDFVGTIGGGNLEFSCIADAREMLAGQLTRKSKRVSLGPGLGQCCGGRVEVLFDIVTTETAWFKELVSDSHVMQRHWLCRSIDGGDTLFIAASDVARTLSGSIAENTKPVTSAVTVSHDDESRWIYQPLSARKPAAWVYGAGHVGQAVVAQLSLLGCQITLLDHREEWLGLQPALELTRVLTETPEEDAVSAPSDAVHVVMTHSHSLDFEICHVLLKNGQFDWLGLIGSATKRQTFHNRLIQRGVDENAIERLRCPIGTLGLESSQPELISLNLAAELALHWQQAGTML